MHTQGYKDFPLMPNISQCGSHMVLQCKIVGGGGGGWDTSVATSTVVAEVQFTLTLKSSIGIMHSTAN